MERLTKRYIDEDDGSKSIGIFNGCIVPEICFEEERGYRVFEKLADYEDAEEQGLLVRLPVPLGSKVYWISTRDKQNPIIFEKIFVLGMLYFWDSTVFATREEAEKKLEEMKVND